VPDFVTVTFVFHDIRVKSVTISPNANF